MADQKPPLSFSKEYEFSQPEKEQGFLFPHKDWDYLKKIISEKNWKATIFNTIGSIFFGVSCSAFVAAIASLNILTNQENNSVSTVCLAVGFVSLLIGILCAYFSSDKRSSSKKQIMEFIHHIENKYRPNWGNPPTAKDDKIDSNLDGFSVDSLHHDAAISGEPKIQDLCKENTIIDFAEIVLRDLLADLAIAKRIGKVWAWKHFVFATEVFLPEIGNFGIDVVFDFYHFDKKMRNEKTLTVGFVLRGTERLVERNRLMKSVADTIFDGFDSVSRTTSPPSCDDPPVHVYWAVENPYGSPNNWTIERVALFTEKVIRYLAKNINFRAP